MKNLLKFGLVFGAFSLSGCAFTNNVLQSAYDQEASKPCERTGEARESIHRRGCAPYDGTEPAKTSKWEEKKTKKKKLED